jgi:hypothetical protein
MKGLRRFKSRSKGRFIIALKNIKGLRKSPKEI